MPRTTSPFRDQEIPFLLIPGVLGPEYALPDSAHIFHIKGVGQDFATSCVVFLAKLGVWRSRSLDSKLQMGYEAFQQWCHASGKTTGIDGFSKIGFDMETKLGNDIVHVWHAHVHAIPILFVQ